MQVGDRVQIIGIPNDLPEGDSKLSTRKTFERSVGHVFEIIGFNEIGWAEIDITALNGSVGETIWIESKFLRKMP